MKYLTDIFFILNGIPIIFELIIFADSEKYCALLKNKTGLENIHPFIAVILLSLVIFTIAVQIIGLITDQWFIFLLLLLMTYVSSRTARMMQIKSTLSIGLFIFAIINHFHLGIKIL